MEDYLGIGEANNPYRYAGYRYDEETGIYYLNARYYDPKIARFLTEDTYLDSIEDLLFLNLYTYCHNEPIMYYDPTGHIEVFDIKLNPSDQKKILEPTEKYYKATTEKERSDIHRQAVEIRQNSGRINDYKDEYKYDIKHTRGGAEYNRIINEAKSSKDKDDRDSGMASTDRDRHEKNLATRGITKNQYQAINNIIRNNLKGTNDIASNGIGIGSSPSPIGVSMKHIEGKANVFVE